MEKLTFRHAERKDAARILEIWESAKTRPYCVWDENYPTVNELESDFEQRVNYCLEDENGVIAAVGTAYRVIEHDDDAVWGSKNPCDLMRIAAASSMRGKGAGRAMLDALIAETKKLGFDSMRILVAKTNLPAVKLYREIGSVLRGETVKEGIEWYCYELMYND